jgi:hypothetical protein
VWCGVVWCGVVWCGVVWCGVVWCGVVWCGVGVVSCFPRKPSFGLCALQLSCAQCSPPINTRHLVHTIPWENLHQKSTRRLPLLETIQYAEITHAQHARTRNTLTHTQLTHATHSATHRNPHESTRNLRNPRNSHATYQCVSLHTNTIHHTHNTLLLLHRYLRKT